MDRAAVERFKATLGRLDDALSSRLSRKRGAAATRKLLERVAGMGDADGHEAAVRRLNQDAALLLRIKAARQRAEKGTFGICLSCHEPVSHMHLNAVPWAAFCIPCRKTADSREADPALQDSLKQEFTSPTPTADAAR